MTIELSLLVAQSKFVLLETECIYDICSVLVRVT